MAESKITFTCTQIYFSSAGHLNPLLLINKQQTLWYSQQT